MFTSKDWDGEPIQTKKPDIFLGLSSAIPLTTLAAWGGRAIISGPAYLDSSTFELPGNRQGFSFQCEIAKKRLKRILDSKVLQKMKDRFAELAAEGKIRPDSEQQILLYEDSTVKAVGNPNGSCGYLYLAAWLKDPVFDDLDSAQLHLAQLRQELGALPTEEEGRSEQTVQVFLGLLYVLKYLQGIAEELEKNKARTNADMREEGLA